MTVKELFEGTLIFTNKEQSPHTHLREFNFYANEVISDVVRDIARAFEANQKSLDYLKAIKRTISITPTPKDDPTDTSDTPQVLEIVNGVYKNSQKFNLPKNYRHLTGVTICYEVTGTEIFDDCYEQGNVFEYGTKPLDSSQRANITADIFQRDRYFQPYHMILDQECYIITGDHPGIDVQRVQFDYLKTPDRVTLTYNQAFVDTEDTSVVMEFDEITCREIRDRLVQMILEKNGDPRTGSYTQISQSQPPADAMDGIGGAQ